jgi:hypothetical protein
VIEPDQTFLFAPQHKTLKEKEWEKRGEEVNHSIKIQPCFYSSKWGVKVYLSIFLPFLPLPPFYVVYLERCVST